MILKNQSNFLRTKEKIQEHKSVSKFIIKETLEGVQDPLVVSALEQVWVFNITKNSFTTKVVFALTQNSYEFFQRQPEYWKKIKESTDKVLSCQCNIDYQIIKGSEQEILEAFPVAEGGWYYFQPNEVLSSVMQVSRPKEKRNFNDYVFSVFNQELEKSKQWLFEEDKQDMGYFSPMFIVSKSGFGKTFFLDLIENIYEEKGYRVLSLRGETFHAQGTTPINPDDTFWINTFPQFVANNYDVVLFDDIQLIGNRPSSSMCLLSVINTFMEQKKHVLVTSDSIPEQLVGFQERFITRFKSGLTVTLKELDHESFKEMVEFFLRKFQLKFLKNDAVDILSFLWKCFSDSIRSLEGAFKNLKLKASYDQKYISAQEVRKIFQAQDRMERTLNARVISEEVAKYFDVDAGTLAIRGKNKNQRMARKIAVYLVKALLKIKAVTVADYFGFSTHASVSNACKSVAERLDQDETTKKAVLKITRELERKKYLLPENKRSLLTLFQLKDNY